MFRLGLRAVALLALSLVAIIPAFGGAVDVYVSVNGALVLNATISGFGETVYYLPSDALTLAEGDKVDFIVGNGGDGNAHDSIGVQANFTAADSSSYSDAATDFALGTNPSGAWSYGWLPSAGVPNPASFALLTLPLSGIPALGSAVDGLGNPITSGINSWSLASFSPNYLPTVGGNTTLDYAYFNTVDNPFVVLANYQLLLYPGAGGQYADLRWTVGEEGAGDYFANANFQGIDTVPEPGTLALLGMGLLGVGLLRRKH